MLNHAGILGLKEDGVFVLQNPGELAGSTTMTERNLFACISGAHKAEQDHKFYQNDAYDAALIMAARRRDEALVRILVERGLMWMPDRP